MSATVTVTRGKTFGASEAITNDKLNSLGLPTISITGVVANTDTYIIAEGGSTAVANGTAFKAAYTSAKALTPGGNALSASNRAAVLILPGEYDLGGEYELDTEYVDIIGVGDRDSTRIFANVTTASTGVIYVNNTDCSLANFTIENTASTGGATTPVALREADAKLCNLYNVHIKADGTNASPMGGKTVAGAWAGEYLQILVDGGLAFKGAEFTGTLRDSVINGANNFGSDIGGLMVNCTVNEFADATNFTGMIRNVYSVGNTWSANPDVATGGVLDGCYFKFSGSALRISGTGTDTKIINSHFERTDAGDALTLAASGSLIAHNSILVNSGNAIGAPSAMSAVIALNYVDGGMAANVTGTATTAVDTSNYS